MTFIIPDLVGFVESNPQLVSERTVGWHAGTGSGGGAVSFEALQALYAVTRLAMSFFAFTGSV
jgi:hypothetical protein